MKIVSLLVAVTAAASLVACGAEEDPSKPASAQTQEAKNRKAMLDYARCMRQNGVDMPDPQFDGKGKVAMKIGKGGLDPNSPAFEEASESCRKEVPGGPMIGGPPPSK